MKTSAGLLLYRIPSSGEVQVLLVHPGGPFWAGKDAGAWSIPKGEYGPEEDPPAAAVREFTEELGSAPPAADPEVADLLLGSVRQSSAKTVLVYARQGDFDSEHVSSNMIEIDWPPRSGRRLKIPEVDRAQWCSLAEATIKLVKGQVSFVERLLAQLPPAAESS